VTSAALVKKLRADDHCHSRTCNASDGNNIGICLIRKPAAAKASVTIRLALVNARAVGIAAAGVSIANIGVSCGLARTLKRETGHEISSRHGVWPALMLGSAYPHDTGVVKAGPAQPFVNWDAVIGMLGR
jgi:hypothetical protein